MAAGPVPSQRPTLYILDALNYIFRAFHALPPLTNTRGQPTGAVYGLASMILRIEREQRPTHFCVVFDGPGKGFRDEIYPAYKAHRPPMPPDLVSQIPLVHRVIDGFGLPTMTVEGVEADDVIATLARQAAAAGLAPVICSGDKDLLQLCDDRIRILDPAENLIGPAEVEAKFGVAPGKLGDLLALTGDSVDNVPGVPDVGPKTAAKWLATYGDLEGVLAHAAEIGGKRGAALLGSSGLARVSRRLVALREDVPLPKALEDLHRIEPDRDRLAALFRELEFSRLAKQLVSSTAGLPAPAPATPVAASLAPDATFDAQARAIDDADAVAHAPMPPVMGASPGPVTIVLEAAGLAALAARLEVADDVGLAALAEGPDPVRADLVGLAFALPDGASFYLPLAHRYLGTPATLREGEALAALGPILAAAEPRKHAHDGKAIEVLLARRGATLGGIGSDPMIAAYLLDASRTRYDLDVVAAADGVGGTVARPAWLGTGKSATRESQVSVEEAGAHLGGEAAAALALRGPHGRRLAEAKLDVLYRDLELPLARVLARVEPRGIKLDTDYLRRLGQEVAASAAALEAEIHRLAGGPFNINSPKQLADVLFGKLSLPVIRKTKTGYSTDADVLEELAAQHPVPAKIVEYRLLTKLKGTYIDALPALVNPGTGRLHTTFNQTVAATGRLSSSDPNLQNIPIRSEVGRRIRQAFVAEPGHLLVSADYSQIELRVLAHFSEDPVLIDAFRAGQDVHQRTACEVFGLPPAAVTAEQRRIAKAINFGLVFGQTDFGLAQALGIPRGQAREYIDGYFRRYAAVKTYMERSIEEARRTGETMTLLGRRRPLPGIRAPRPADRAYAERIARNTPIQGSAADLLKLAMIRVEAGLERRGDARLLLTVHDELVFEVSEAAVESFRPWVKHEMESVQELRVPITVDIGAGPNWGAAHSP